MPQRAGDHQEGVVQQRAGDHQEGVVQQQDVVLVVEVVLPLLVAVQVREGEAQGAAGREGAQGTGGIATEKALEVTTGDFGGGRPSLGWASTWPRVPVARRPSLSRARPITIGAGFTMLRLVPAMLSSRRRPVPSFMPCPPRQPSCMWEQPPTTIMVEPITS